MSFFTRSYNPELYFFLKDAYEFLNINDDEEQFRAKLTALQLTFLAKGSPQETNITIPLQNSFLSQYDDFQEGEDDKNSVRNTVVEIVAYLEKIVFNNFALNFKDFTAHLEQDHSNTYLRQHQSGQAIINIDGISQPKNNITLTTEEDSCCRCSLF